MSIQIPLIVTSQTEVPAKTSDVSVRFNIFYSHEINIEGQGICCNHETLLSFSISVFCFRLFQYQQLDRALRHSLPHRTEDGQWHDVLCDQLTAPSGEEKEKRDRNTPKWRG